MPDSAAIDSPPRPRPLDAAAEAVRPSSGAAAALLREHVVEAWFPRCIDADHGGYLMDFDRQWRPVGAQEKGAETQARQARTAAELAELFQDEALHQAALHGWRHLSQTMWDSRHGGWFHRTSRGGEPLEARSKHAHGLAYGISACAVLHATSRVEGALELAKEGFAWLEAHAHDAEHGGYFGMLADDGTAVRRPSENPIGGPHDTIGTPVELKDLNVHSDLIDTFTSLYRVWPDPLVEQRLREVVDIVFRRSRLPGGTSAYFWFPDFRPAPHLVRYGYACHAAIRLYAARDLIGEPEQTVIDNARRMATAALRLGWDRERNGVFLAGPAFPPLELDGRSLVVRLKSWWVQFEALQAMLSLSLAAGQDEFRTLFRRQWDYVVRYLVDHERKGLYGEGLDTAEAGGEASMAQAMLKGTFWKDASHEARAWTDCMRLLA